VSKPQYLSVCSGIEAATVAWEPLGWEAVGFSEIESFPCAVLAHHYPHVPMHGDFTALIADPPPCDVLVGGTPCQAFSVAGERRSLDDARGNLSLAYVDLANAIDRKNRDQGKSACITVWENVPGVFSTHDNAFGCFLGALAGENVPLEPPGGKWTHCGAVLGPQRAIAWRVLDAQYFGLAQRRRRVFVVASAREGFDPLQVLLEWEGVRRDSAPSRQARQEAPAPLGCRVAERDGGDCYLGNAEGGAEAVPFLTSSSLQKGVNNQTPLVGVAVMECPDVAGPLGGAGQSGGFRTTDLDNNGAYIVDIVDSFPWPQDVADPLTSSETYTHEGNTFRTRNVVPHYFDGVADLAAPEPAARMMVRRLTPRERERLQGFPDDWTLIPWKNKPASDCPDGPRYKALGNSMAVPVMHWIGRRIDEKLKERP